ncbi:MAG: hypothetical protein GC149_19480 [Gammaproteobacteria bacterium]|nr:hypothetical protein [Gammaproteobacteria bacterium]
MKSWVFRFSVPVFFVIVLAGFLSNYVSVLPSPEWKSAARPIWLCVNILAVWAVFLRLYRYDGREDWKKAAMTGILVIGFGAISWNGLLITVPWLMAKDDSKKARVLVVMQERLIHVRGRCARRISVEHGATKDRFVICLDEEPWPAVGEELALEGRRTWFGLVVDRVVKGQ